MSNDHGDARSPEEAAFERTMIQAALGLRAFRGSREALLRAAFDVIDTTPGIRIERRSLVWRCPASGALPSEHLCAALGLTTRLTIEELVAMATAIEAQVNGPAGGPSRPLVVDLLWAHDPEGKPQPAEPAHDPAIPFPANVPKVIAKLQEPTPPPPPGRSVVNPEVVTRASACGPLAEVAPDAQDPVTGRYLSENLYTVPEPYIHSPQPFTPSFRSEARASDQGPLVTTEALDRADLLAASAEAFCGAQPCGEPVSPNTVLPQTVLTMGTGVPSGSSDDDRMLLWLRAVRAALAHAPFRVRRVVVLADDADVVQGQLLGSPASIALDLGRPGNLATRLDPTSGRHHVSMIRTR